MKKYTIKEALKAKEELIKLGMPEEDFFYADAIDEECGFLLGEPLLSNDDFAVSAYQLYLDKLFYEKHEEDFIDYMLNYDNNRI